MILFLLLIVRRRGVLANTWLLALLVMGLFLTVAGQAHTSSLMELTDKLDRHSVIITGRIQSLAHPLSSGRGWDWVLQTKVVECQGQSWRMAKKVKLVAFGPGKPALVLGTRVRLKGLFTSYEGPHNPGEFNFARLQLQKGIIGQVMVNDPALVSIQHQPGSWQWTTWISRGHAYILTTLNHYCPAPMRPWLQALLLGDRRMLAPLDQQIMAISGLAHVLAISGLHMGIIFAAVVMGLGLLGLPPGWRFILALVMVMGFTLMIGTPFSAVRAVIMLGCGMLLWVQLGPKDGWSAWALALLLVLASHPLAVLNAGLQLSFAATAAILVVWPRLPKIAKPWLRWPAHLLIISVVIFCFTSGLMMMHFNLLAPVAVVGNLVIIPLLTVALLTGLAMVLLGGLWPAMAGLLGQSSGLALTGISAVAKVSTMVPYSYGYGSTPPAGLVLTGYGLILIFIVYRLKPIFKITLLGGWCAGCLVLACWPQSQPQVRITALALQRGEAVVIEHDHRVLLVDCGTQKDFLYQVYPFLKQRGINRIEALLLSHQDQDHSGGAKACLQLFHVAHCLTAGNWIQQQPELMTLMAKKHTRLHVMVRPATWSLAPDWKLRCLWPPPGASRSSNLTCLVVDMTLAGEHLLFTGDSLREVEACWQQVPSCLLLKAGHHGDDQATSHGLLVRTRPQLVLVCAGTRNPYGLPDEATLMRIQKHQAVLLDSKTHGAVEVSWDQGHNPHWRFWQ